MRCTQCSSLEDRVVDSRTVRDGFSIRRRRECVDCGFRVTTYEQIEQACLLVIKRDDTREPFKRDKLLTGLIKAVEKRPVSMETLEKAVDDITNQFHAEDLKEVPTPRIGLVVMDRLQQIDPVAFVRYASVYRQFQEVGEFNEVIESLEKSPSSQKTTGNSQVTTPC